MNAAVLEVRNLTRSFGGIVASDHVDFSLNRHELHCLIGPNGAGKSTLFKLIMGLLKPQSGTILFEDEDITHRQPHERARLGLSMKYQTTRIFPGLSVAQNINVAQSRRGNADAGLMYWAVERFGLHHHLSCPADTLSYGEQHWLEMCMVLGNQPQLVLMDEPTAGMTPDETENTARFLEELNAKGVAIIVIEHDMAFVRSIARKVTVLHQGRTFRQGTVAEIEHDLDVQRIYLGEAHD